MNKREELRTICSEEPSVSMEEREEVCAEKKTGSQQGRE